MECGDNNEIERFGIGLLPAGSALLGLLAAGA